MVQFSVVMGQNGKLFRQQMLTIFNVLILYLLNVIIAQIFYKQNLLNWTFSLDLQTIVIKEGCNFILI